MKSTKPKKYYYFQLNTTESQPVPFITPVDFLNHTNYSQLGSQNLTNVTAGPHVHHSHRNKTHVSQRPCPAEQSEQLCFIYKVAIHAVLT
jgi:hypothetical protein